jgi:hypothetical protein
MNNIHCIPVGNGEPMHECHTLCWCHPVKDTESVNLYAHNAKDCREKWERQGLDMPPQSLWVTVEEKLNAPALAQPENQNQPSNT